MTASNIRKQLDVITVKPTDNPCDVSDKIVEIEALYTRTGCALMDSNKERQLGEISS